MMLQRGPEGKYNQPRLCPDAPFNRSEYSKESAPQPGTVSALLTFDKHCRTKNIFCVDLNPQNLFRAPGASRALCVLKEIKAHLQRDPRHMSVDEWVAESPENKLNPRTTQQISRKKIHHPRTHTSTRELQKILGLVFAVICSPLKCISFEISLAK